MHNFLHQLLYSIHQSPYDSIKYANRIRNVKLLVLESSRSADGPNRVSHRWGRLIERTHSHPVTLFTGACSFKKHLFWISALISAPGPAVIPASCTMSNLPVRMTLCATVFTSQGNIVRKSMSSTFADRMEAGTWGAKEGGGDRNK
jgi:hypothetical protein